MNMAYAAIGIPMAVFLWLYLEMSNDSINPILNPPTEYVFIGIASILVGIFIWMSVKIFKNGLSLAKEESLLKDKLIIYEKISKRKFLFLFIASVITTLGLYLCANELFGVLYAVLIFFFSFGNPTRDKIAEDLRLSREHKKTILTGEDFNFEY